MIRFARLAMPALLLVVSSTAFAASAPTGGEVAAPPASELNILPVLSSLGALVLGVVQLVLGLGLAAFAMTKGLAVLSKLLGGIDIWGEIRKRNPAVALLAAGVVVSYTTVIGGGIESMSRALYVIGNDPYGGITGLVSGLINVAIAVLVANFAITVVFKVMDKLTVGLDERQEFADGNVAIGIVYCGALVGVSGLVANGVKGISSGVGMLGTSLYHLAFG